MDKIDFSKLITRGELEDLLSEVLSKINNLSVKVAKLEVAIIRGKEIKDQRISNNLKKSLKKGLDCAYKALLSDLTGEQ